MPRNDKLYLMLHEERDQGQLASGSDPITAVEAHYAEMDAWCSPSPDVDIHEEFALSLYEIPPALEESAQARFEELEVDDFPKEAVAFLAENPGIKAIELNVLYTSTEGAKASIMPRLPDLFHRMDDR